MKITSVVNQKGGVGKTTTTVNLGVGLAKKGRHVLLIDLDPQGDLSAYLGIKSPEFTIAQALTDIIDDKTPEFSKYIQLNDEGVDIIPANLDLAGIELPLAQALGGQTALKDLISLLEGYEYDDIIIDCPPSLGILTINALAASTGVIIPVQTHFFAMKALTDLIETVERVKRKLNRELSIQGILFTGFEKQTVIGQEVIKQVMETYKGVYPVFESVIPKAISTAESPAMGVSMFTYDPNSKVTKAYESLCEECANGTRT